MAFWGVYLKPNEPYTLHYDHHNVPIRLRITQATLGDATRNSPARSIVKCSVGDKPAIAICSLSVKELTCCQLDLEFEESNDVVFSVMGPRGVYLAGYLVAPGHDSQQLSIDHDLHKDDIDFNVTDPVKESIEAQSTGIERTDENIKGGKRLLKYSRNKKIITLDQKTGKDGNEDQEKTIAVKTHSAFGRLLEKKSRQVTEKKMQRNRNRNRKRKRKQNNCEATSSEYVDDLRSSGAPEGNNENLKERRKKKKSDGSKDCCRKKKN